MKNVLTLFFLFIEFSHALAQSVSAEKKEETKLVVASATIPSSSNSGFLPYQNFTKVSASNDGTSAEASINYKTKKALNVSINIATPVTSKSQQTKPITISGISNNSSVKLGIQKILWGKDFKWDTGKYNAAIKKIGGDPDNFRYDDLTDEQKIEFDEAAAIEWGNAFYFGGKIGFEQQTFSYLVNSNTSTEFKEDDANLYYRFQEVLVS